VYVVRQAICEFKARLKVQESVIVCVRVKVRATRGRQPLHVLHRYSQPRYGDYDKQRNKLNKHTN
jgi:hypothetical protein